MNDIYSIYRQIRECESVLCKDWMWMVRYYRSFLLSTVFIYIKNIHYQEPTYSYYIQYQQYWLYYIQYIQYSLFVLVCLYIYYIQYYYIQQYIECRYIIIIIYSIVVQNRLYIFVCTYIIYSICSQQYNIFFSNIRIYGSFSLYLYCYKNKSNKL